MAGDVITFTCAALVAYVWLASAAGPLLAALRTTARGESTRAAPTAIVMALACAATATATLAAALFLIATWLPGGTLTVAGSRAFAFGVLGGTAAWTLRACVGRAPRLPVAIELNLALAPFCLRTDHELRRLSQLYLAH